MACCLTAPSHHLNQFWLIIIEAHWHLPEGNIAETALDISHNKVFFENCTFENIATSFRGQWVNATRHMTAVVWICILAPIPLTVFQLNMKFDQNLECFSLKYDQPITAKFCTRHDSYTVVTCVKFRVISWVHFKPEYWKFWLNFEFDRNIVSGTGAWCPIIHVKTLQLTWRWGTSGWQHKQSVQAIQYWWLSARLQYLQWVSNGDTAVLH